MASKKLMDLLNLAASMELQVAIQYIWQHIKVSGLEAETVADVLEKTAITEMKHYERLAERIDYFGGNPTTKPAEIKFGNTTKEMLELDKEAEEGAIKVYKDIIKVAIEEGDNTTRVLVDSILKDEEDHHYKFKTLLGL
jgi:bacterioferritin